MDLLPDTDERAEKLFHEYVSLSVANDLVITYKSFRKHYPAPEAYIMTLYDMIKDLDDLVQWDDE